MEKSNTSGGGGVTCSIGFMLINSISITETSRKCLNSKQIILPGLECHNVFVVQL